MLEGSRQREKIRRDEYIFLAWHMEALARQKRLPKLSALFKQKPAAEKDTAPIEELLAIAEKKGLKIPGKEV